MFENLSPQLRERSDLPEEAKPGQEQAYPAKCSGFTVWLTGRPCVGKSTVSQRLQEEFQKRGQAVSVFDGDEIRTSLCADLGFSPRDRHLNNLRVGWVAARLNHHGVACIVAQVSPYRKTRAELRQQIDSFVEVFLDCSPQELLRRDVKGMYQKALLGKLRNFTGVDDPYEEPDNPEVYCSTEQETPEDTARRILNYLEEAGLLKRGTP